MSTDIAHQKKFHAAQTRAASAAHEIQRELNQSYRQGFLDGSANERQLLLLELRNLFTKFTTVCEARGQQQEADLNAIPDLDGLEETGELSDDVRSAIAQRFKPGIGDLQTEKPPAILSQVPAVTSRASAPKK